MLIWLVGFSALVFIYLLSTSLASSHGVKLVLDLVLVAIIVGFQIYYICRIAKDWDTMTTGQRWKTGIAAFTVPLLAAVFIPVAIVLGLLFAGLNVFARNSGGSAPASAWVDSTRPDEWAPEFGHYWGNEEVIYGSDGRPSWVGSEKVSYGPDGQPSRVGNRQVRYGADHRPAWIGPDRVVFDPVTDTPRWIGDQEVR